MLLSIEKFRNFFELKSKDLKINGSILVGYRIQFEVDFIDLIGDNFSFKKNIVCN